jgi:DNA-binding CsgD family transcriptional regulator
MAKKLTNEDHALPSLSLVFGYTAVKELRRLEDRIAVLVRLGYGIAEIATICETTPATVRTINKSALKDRPEVTKNSEDTAIRQMLGYLCIANETEASLIRKVEILARFGLSDKDIATICNRTIQSVRDARVKLKKKTHGKNKKR